MITSEELVGITGEERQQNSYKLGIITELFDIGTAKVQFDGEETASDKELSYLASYTPKINDRVLLASVGGTYIILDAIYYKQAPNDSIDKLSKDIADINGFFYRGAGCSISAPSTGRWIVFIHHDSSHYGIFMIYNNTLVTLNKAGLVSMEYSNFTFSWEWTLYLLAIKIY